MLSASLSLESQIDYYLRREREERLAASHARDDATRDQHFMEAERFADRAWALGEESGNFVPSGLWA